MVTLSPTISFSTHRLIASLPQNSRCTSLTKASSAKVATIPLVSKAFSAAMYWAIIGCNVFVMRCSFSFASLGLLPTEGPEESIVHPVRGESRGHAQIDSPVGGESILFSRNTHDHLGRISTY